MSDVKLIQPVIISNVPTVGDHVWFISRDELTDGMWINGEVIEVNLDNIRVKSNEEYWNDLENRWTLPLNDERYPLSFSYESFLYNEVKRLTIENNTYRKKFGALNPDPDTFED